MLDRVSPPTRARRLWSAADRLGDPTGPLLDALVPHGAVVVDAGAGWGFHTERLARNASRVVAFEPNPAHHRSLGRIARAAGNVEVRHVALSDAPGAGALRLPLAEGEPVAELGTLAPPGERAALYTESVDVELTTLDAALGDELAGAVAFVKIDVEGHEPALLRGAERTLASLPTIHVEIEQRHQEGDIRETFAWLEARGYEGFSVRPEGLSPLTDFDLERDQLRHLAPSGVLQPSPGHGGYVNDFVFAAPSIGAARLTAP